MPISFTCNCGKKLNVKDELAGKAVKCPSCAKPVKVPGGGAASAPVAAPSPVAAPAPAQPASSSRMSDLFDEEGFSAKVEAVCPACRAEMTGGAVLCTKCGYNKESGLQFDRHMTAGVDITAGTLALEKAERDMAKEKVMQEKMLSGAGMPWWMLALVLFMIGSALTIAVLVVNASRRVDEAAPSNPVGLFMALMGSALCLVSLGAYWMIVVHAFKKMGPQGLLTLILPYGIYYVFQNAKDTWKFLAVAIVAGGIAGGLLGVAASQGGI